MNQVTYFDESTQHLFDLIKASLWGSSASEVDEAVYREMKLHALTALPGGIFNSLQMPDALRQMWQQEIYQQISFNVNYRREQALLPITVPYVILKGTAAAKYYPYPILRAMGDIDIMTRREDHAAACDELLRNGFNEYVNEMAQSSGRHRQFSRNGLQVEVHTFYAHMNDPEKARILDDLILHQINASHDLPDGVNGLTLIDHINHHIESGLGLRQIIDWMMYVKCCLSDEKWEMFLALAKQTGHEQLAVITTRMCELYLGLPEHRFCAQADTEICRRFMEYVLECGNFGKKQEETRVTSQRFLSSTRTIKGTFQYLQGRGMKNWSAVKKYKFLHSFAWLHQIIRYIDRGLHRKNTLSKFKQELAAAQRRNALFDALGVSREEKGIVTYKEGKYTK